MKLPKPVNNLSIDKPKPIDRFAFITNDHAKLVIPVGPRFQAEVPSWTLPVSRSCLTTDDRESHDSKWLGTLVWPVKGRCQSTKDDMVGRGRSGSCECVFPGSIECVKRHVSKKRFQLQIDLGPPFWIWKFDEMGDNVSKSWNHEEQKKFEYIVRMNALPEGKSFIDLALECFPGRSKRSIVSYYLNVYIPRRISVQTRSSCITIDTDDEGDDIDGTPHLKGSRKRFQANSCASRSCKYIKTTYLTTRR